ncbi:MBL fold metallo-hydrolase [Oceanobacillus iheyensis]|uniref:MBL fold metallo-hydrolase n=1 Tax=Oceanobacillus iheyensis TaxID=182710 RepID=UPI0002E15460|nr:MBL fold metallo-hydrolase [Oceanobacillus iheyensis]
MMKKMSAHELTRRILQKDELFILDVRNQSDFEEWKVEGEKLTQKNIPYFELLEGVDGLVSELPSDKDILVVCAKEGSSVMISEMLSEKGIDVFYLEGGMKAWSEHVEPIKLGDLNGKGELYQFVRIGKGCLSYMVLSNGEAAIIDSTRMIDKYTTFAKEKEVKIIHTIDTHLHADHISGGRKLAEQTGGYYWLPPRDAEEVTFHYERLQDGSQLTVGSSTIDIKAIHTPGHTIGSTSLIIDGMYLLTGDILFIDSIGRPDLAGKAKSWGDDLRDSLYNKYKDLSGELIVLPAHFMIMKELNEDGTVAKKLSKLYEENHGLNMDEEAFTKSVTTNLPPQPNSYQEIRETNLGKISPDAEQQREMEIGPNRCAIR